MDQLGEWKGARDTRIWPAVVAVGLALAVVAVSAGVLLGVQLLLTHHFTWAT